MMPRVIIKPTAALYVQKLNKFQVVPVFFALIACSMANENVKAVSAGNNAFTNKLYNELAKTSKGNVFFSPISAYTALSLLRQGSEGATDQALRTSLALPEDKLKDADGFQNVMSALNSVVNVTLNIANRVYVMEGYTMKQSFKDVATNNFFAGAENINFANNVAAAQTINTWVEDKTNNKIKDLIAPDALDALTRMVLVNAIYFKGDWAKKFDKKDTISEPFYTSATDSVPCDMMHMTDHFKYKFDTALNAQVIQLPYKNQDLSMIVILPKERTGITDLESKLTNYDLSKITNGMMSQEVILSLPKFKIETEAMDLNEPLTNIGLGNIFSNSANFSGLLDSKEPLTVSKVVQKAFIEVNEEGSEAAAATGIVMMARCMPVAIRKEVFKADHPFAFYLFHKNFVMFSGKLFSEF